MTRASPTGKYIPSTNVLHAAFELFGCIESRFTRGLAWLRGTVSVGKAKVLAMTLLVGRPIFVCVAIFSRRAAILRGMRAKTLVYVFLMSACVAGGLNGARTGDPFSLIAFGLAGYAALWLAIASRNRPA